MSIPKGRDESFKGPANKLAPRPAEHSLSCGIGHNDQTGSIYRKNSLSCGLQQERKPVFLLALAGLQIQFDPFARGDVLNNAEEGRRSGLQHSKGGDPARLTIRMHHAVFNVVCAALRDGALETKPNPRDVVRMNVPSAVLQPFDHLMRIEPVHHLAGVVDTEAPAVQVILPGSQVRTLQT